MSRLRDLREGRDLSQRACAALIGVKQGTFQLWEVGKSIPSSLSAERYAEVLGITMTELNDLLLEAKTERKRNQDTDSAPPNNA